MQLQATYPLGSPLSSPSTMEKVGKHIAELFAQRGRPVSSYMQGKLRDTVDRAQITTAMPAELKEVLPMPEAEVGIHGQVRAPRLSFSGVDARFSFAIPVPDANGQTRMRSAKHFMPLFDGADHSYRPGKQPPVLLSVAGEIQTVDKLIAGLTKSPNLLANIPHVSARDVQVDELSIKELVAENGPKRKWVTWALCDALPSRYAIVKANGEISLLDSQQGQVYPSSALEKGWDIRGLEKGPSGFTMQPIQEVALPKEFQAARLSGANRSVTDSLDPKGFPTSKAPGGHSHTSVLGDADEVGAALRPVERMGKDLGHEIGAGFRQFNAGMAWQDRSDQLHQLAATVGQLPDAEKAAARRDVTVNVYQNLLGLPENSFQRALGLSGFRELGKVVPPNAESFATLVKNHAAGTHDTKQDAQFGDRLGHLVDLAPKEYLAFTKQGTPSFQQLESVLPKPGQGRGMDI